MALLGQWFGLSRRQPILLPYGHGSDFSLLRNSNDFAIPRHPPKHSMVSTHVAQRTHVRTLVNLRVVHSKVRAHDPKYESRDDLKAPLPMSKKSLGFHFRRVDHTPLDSFVQRRAALGP
eukprot:scaffold122706_cov31-Tisochrysis_lutea.AAC.1